MCVCVTHHTNTFMQRDRETERQTDRHTHREREREREILGHAY